MKMMFEYLRGPMEPKQDERLYDYARELAFDLMVQRGLKDSDEQRVILQ